MEPQPITAQDYLKRAEQFYDTSDYERAIADCDMALQLEPDNAKAWYWRGYCGDFGIRDAAHVVADYTEAIRLDPTYVDAYFSRALVYQFDLRDADKEAIADLTAVITLEPDQANYYQMRGFLYFRVGNDSAAMSDFNTAIELEPSHDGYRHRARLRSHLGDYAGALADCDAALLLNLDWSFYAHEGKGDIYDAMGDFKSAVREYTILLNNDDSAGNWNSRAWIYYRQGEYDAALADANEAIQHDEGSHWEHLHTRGAIYAATNQVASAVEDYQAALDLEPDVEQDKQDMIAYIADNNP